jgi:hypothetical protein
MCLQANGIKVPLAFFGRKMPVWDIGQYCNIIGREFHQQLG